MPRRKRYGARYTQRTQNFITLNEQQKKWIDAMLADEEFCKQLFKKNKLYFYAVRKAQRVGNYSDAPASRRTMSNACAEWAKWCKKNREDREIIETVFSR